MCAEGREVGGRLFGGCLTVRANLQFWAKPQVEAAQFPPQDRAFEKLESSSAGTELVPHRSTPTLPGHPHPPGQNPAWTARVRSAAKCLTVSLGDGWGAEGMHVGIYKLKFIINFTNKNNVYHRLCK